MFPDIVRDDVFRVETKRLWLRWPRLADAGAIESYSSNWEVARHTARIPHPYPRGGAESFVYAAREANALGRELRLVLTPISAWDRAIGSVSLEPRGADRLTLGYALAPAVWGRGLASEATRAIVDVGFQLTRAAAIEASAHVENPASRRVLERAGFSWVGSGLHDAPARGAMVECDDFAYTRAEWTARTAAASLEATP
jgi:RimJ/RimL family protein N-acetyltransferase